MAQILQLPKNRPTKKSEEPLLTKSGFDLRAALEEIRDIKQEPWDFDQWLLETADEEA